MNNQGIKQNNMDPLDKVKKKLKLLNSKIRKSNEFALYTEDEDNKCKVYRIKSDQTLDTALSSKTFEEVEIRDHFVLAMNIGGIKSKYTIEAYCRDVDRNLLENYSNEIIRFDVDKDKPIIAFKTASNDSVVIINRFGEETKIDIASVLNNLEGYSISVIINKQVYGTEIVYYVCISVITSENVALKILVAAVDENGRGTVNTIKNFGVKRCILSVEDLTIPNGDKNIIKDKFLNEIDNKKINYIKKIEYNKILIPSAELGLRPTGAKCSEFLEPIDKSKLFRSPDLIDKSELTYRPLDVIEKYRGLLGRQEQDKRGKY